jgi:ABC-2 type transport system permease protein
VDGQQDMRVSHLQAIIVSELKQVWNNKRNVLLMVVAPVITGIIFGFVAYRSPTAMDTTVFVDNPLHLPASAQVQKLISDISNYRRDDGSKPFSVTVELDSQGAAMKRLEEGKTRAVIIIRQGEDGIESIKVVTDVAETLLSVEFQQILPKIFSSYAKEISIQDLSEFLQEQMGVPASTATQESNQIMTPFKATFKSNAGKDLKYFDFYASAYMVIMAIVLPMNISLMSLTSERSTGTIERIFVSPYGRSEIITGKLLAHSIFALIYSALFVFTLKAVFNVALGNMGLVLLTCTLMGITGVILGLVISAVTRTEAESLLVGMMVFLGSAALMTYMVPLETMNVVAKYLSQAIPFTYGIETIRRINMVGLGLSDVWINLVIIFGFIVALTVVAIPILRRQVT